jgi:hypothetical protein
MPVTIRKLQEEFGGLWGEHPDYPVDEWQAEVANDDTRKGYWEWVKAKIEDEEDEPTRSSLVIHSWGRARISACGQPSSGSTMLTIAA